MTKMTGTRTLVIENLNLADLAAGMVGQEICHFSVYKINRDNVRTRIYDAQELELIDWMIRTTEVEDKLTAEFGGVQGGLEGGCILPESFDFQELIRSGKYNFILSVTTDKDGHLEFTQITLY